MKRELGQMQLHARMKAFDRILYEFQHNMSTISIRHLWLDSEESSKEYQLITFGQNTNKKGIWTNFINPIL